MWISLFILMTKLDNYYKTYSDNPAWGVDATVKACNKQNQLELRTKRENDWLYSRTPLTL